MACCIAAHVLTAMRRSNSPIKWFEDEVGSGQNVTGMVLGMVGAAADRPGPHQKNAKPEYLEYGRAARRTRSR